MSSIFLSHNHKDKPFVNRLAKDLEAQGFSVWIDEFEIKLGDSLIAKIRHGIDNAEYLGVVLSENSINSEWVKREVDIAMNQEIDGKRVKVLPLMLHNIELPGFLKGKLYADFTADDRYADNLKKIIDRLCESSIVKTETLALSHIPNETFKENHSLVSVKIPNGTVSIGWSAFTNCHNLTDVDIPDSVTTIEDWAFSSCIKLAMVKLPNNIKKISQHLFHGCASLKEIKIPNAVTEIDNFAFESCYKLVLIELPNRLVRIGRGAFMSCEHLTAIKLPSSLTRIEKRAFSDCILLPTIEIPERVTYIGESAFGNCPNLKFVTIHSKREEIKIDSMAFQSHTKLLFVDD